jgi:hypothetical protein
VPGRHRILAADEAVRWGLHRKVHRGCGVCNALDTVGMADSY